MDIKLEYSGLSCLLGALLFLTIPLGWLLAALTAAVIHELCHILVVRFLGGYIYSLRIGSNGAVLDAFQMDFWKKLLCILSGPMGSIMLLFLSPWFPRIAFCGLMQGCFNLLPVYPLDGGRAAACIAYALFSANTAHIVCLTIERIFRILLLAAGIYGTVALKLGLMPVFTSLIFFVRTMDGKFSCKEGDLGVQYSNHI